ncbi:hypothetical protein Clacol_006002 [Clathrus columnatus]|uniref:Shugoshin C-terminal domain-containing protein n=1 Tax=Clathrus columnatus TaxID=1419009 RepID=A0AAV5AF04_9AGAM|nr:hypothetical protein Clacol_006002 [Clathrus columnatus]
MSGRRDSRVHLTERQNDALLEFENFKRKYLLVNKHITKLNSTLSVRVEELNVQLSTLYTENLRLRASEVSLKTQLKKERQRSQKIIIQTEHAVGALMTQLSGLRASTGGLIEDTHNPVSTRRKPFSSPVQPPRETIRLARAPADIITQIHESEEEKDGDDDDDDVPTRTITSCRPSISRLPLPKHTSYHHHPPTSVDASEEKDKPRNIDLDMMVNKQRKLGRRNSSLFVADLTAVAATPASVAQRAPSPVDGPSKRPRRRLSDERRSSLEEDDHEIEQQIESDLDPEVILPLATKDVQPPPISQGNFPPPLINVGADLPHPDPPEPAALKPKSSKTALQIRHDPEPQSASERESSDSKDRRRLVIKDVTNSPRRSSSDFVERVNEKSGLSRTTSPTPDTGLMDALTPKPMSTHISSAVSTPATESGGENGFEVTGQNIGGRERRTRKTLNYAEPKLNTKMRKPSPPPDATRPRTSGAGVTIRRRRSINPALVSDEDGDADVEGTTSIKNTGRRKTVHNGATPHEGSHPISLGIGTIDTDEMESRRRSLALRGSFGGGPYTKLYIYIPRVVVTYKAARRNEIYEEIKMYKLDVAKPNLQASGTATTAAGAATASSSSSNNLVLILTFIVLCLCLVLSCAVLIYVYVRSKRRHLKAQSMAHKDKSSIAPVLPLLLASSFHSRTTKFFWWDNPAFRSSSLWLLTSKQSFRTGLDHDVAVERSGLGLTDSDTPSSEMSSSLIKRSITIPSLASTPIQSKGMVFPRSTSSSSNWSDDTICQSRSASLTVKRNLTISSLALVPMSRKTSLSGSPSSHCTDDTVPSLLTRNNSMNSTSEDVDADLRSLISKHESFIRNKGLIKVKSDRWNRNRKKLAIMSSSSSSSTAQARARTRRFSALQLFRDEDNKSSYIKDFERLSHPPLAHLR